MPSSKHWFDCEGVPVHTFAHSHHRWHNHEFALRAAHFMSSVRRRIEIVYFSMTGLHLATCVPAARLLGLPIIMKFSGSGSISSLTQTRLGRLELSWIRQYAAKVMVLNEGMFREAIDTGFQPNQLVWMPNPVDSSYFHPLSEAQRRELRRELGVREGSYVIVYSGRLAPEKQLSTLIKSLRHIGSEQTSTTLVLVGDGPERAALEGIAAAHPEITIRFAGRVGADVVRKWLQVADVFALVSSHEGFSCALIEAMSVGLPSVVSNIPGNSQLITDERNGLVTELGNEQEVANALSRLSRDPDLRRALGAAARRLVAGKYTPESVAMRYEDLFDTVLSRDVPDKSASEAHLA